MRQQKGCIGIDRGNWSLRWRETVRDGETVTRKMRFKILGPVTSEHMRNKDRKTGKPRIPADIEAEAKRVMEPVATAPLSVLATIGTVAQQFMEHKKKTMRHASYAAYSSCWNLHLRDRMSRKVLRDFERKDAFELWERIAHDSPELSRKTLANIRIFVSGLFKWALDRGLYKGENPARASLPAGLRGRGETEAYTIDDVARLLTMIVNPMYQAVVALAWGSGMGKSELQGLRWQDYERTDSGATINIRQSCVDGHFAEPKTANRKDYVKIDSVICEYMDAYTEMCGNPTEGLMFAYSNGRPLNLQSYAKKTLVPQILNRCAICNEKQSRHRKAKHEFVRDESLPRWKGWHAFRRGNATFIAQNGGAGSEGVRVASIALRHGGTQVTQEHYIKNSKQEQRAISAGKLLEIDEARSKAAGMVGQGLKRALQ